MLVKLTPLVNFINIIQAAFAPISVQLKFTNTKSCTNTFMRKKLFVKCWWLTPCRRNRSRPQERNERYRFRCTSSCHLPSISSTLNARIFHTNVGFWQFFLVTCTLPKRRLFEIFISLTLMKLPPWQEHTRPELLTTPIPIVRSVRLKLGNPWVLPTIVSKWKKLNLENLKLD